jgi:hypothetical protein
MAARRNIKAKIISVKASMSIAGINNHRKIMANNNNNNRSNGGNVANGVMYRSVRKWRISREIWRSVAMSSSYLAYQWRNVAAQW